MPFSEKVAEVLAAPLTPTLSHRERELVWRCGQVRKLICNQVDAEDEWRTSELI
jgi:hypothetical protein